jgi:hypothetical protein
VSCDSRRECANLLLTSGCLDVSLSPSLSGVVVGDMCEFPLATGDVFGDGSCVVMNRENCRCCSEFCGNNPLALTGCFSFGFAADGKPTSIIDNEMENLYLKL